jgi:hypothetical protein
MGIDYVVNLDCPVKQKFPTDELVRLVKGRNNAEMVADLSAERGDMRPPSEITFTRMLNTPEGMFEQTVTIQSLLDESKELFDLAHHCKDCPANVLQGDFGCWGYITYPIPVATEEWLLSLLPSSINSMAGRLLREAIKDFKYDGGPFNKMRQDGTFFERKQPAVRSWKLGGILSGAFKVTSSQILELMFAVGPVQPAHICLLMFFFGLVPNDSDPQILTDPSQLLEAVDFSCLNSAGDNPFNGEMANFLIACGAALSLDVEVVVDF